MTEVPVELRPTGSARGIAVPARRVEAGAPANGHLRAEISPETVAYLASALGLRLTTGADPSVVEVEILPDGTRRLVNPGRPDDPEDVGREVLAADAHRLADAVFRLPGVEAGELGSALRRLARALEKREIAEPVAAEPITAELASVEPVLVGRGVCHVAGNRGTVIAGGWIDRGYDLVVELPDGTLQIWRSIDVRLDPRAIA